MRSVERTAATWDSTLPRSLPDFDPVEAASTIFLEPARTPILFLLEPARTPILFRLVSGTEGLGAGLTLGSSSCALQKRIQSPLPPSNATADLGQYSTVLPLFKFNSTGCILSYVFL